MARENDRNYSFHKEYGSVQILFMPDDTYFTDYGAAVDRNGYLVRILKREGYRRIMGMERRGQQYHTWNREETKRQPIPMFSGFGTLGLGSEFESEQPRRLFERGLDAVRMLEEKLGNWMTAGEPFAFVIPAADWLGLMDQDREQNGEKLFWKCREIWKDAERNGILLLLFSPVSDWNKDYKRVLELFRRWELSAPKGDVEKNDSAGKWQVQLLAEQNVGKVSYIPSLTVKNVERMLVHEYVTRYPEFPLEFSRLEEAAKELICLLDMEDDRNLSGSEELMGKINGICNLDPTCPIRMLRSYLGKPGMKATFDSYLNERAPRYRSWGEIPFSRVDELEIHLKGRFKGEDQPIHEFCEAVKECIQECRKREKLREKAERHPEEREKILKEIKKGPPMVIFQAGPTRTGKSDVPREAVNFLFGNMERFATFDGTNLTTEGSSRILLGALPGTKGYDQTNAWKQFLRRETCGLFLVDEVHKISSDVRDLFMSMTEESDGKITFSTQETLNLSEIMVVYTSNNGCIQSDLTGDIPDYETLKQKVETSYMTVKSPADPSACGFEEPWRSRVKKFIVYDYIRPEAVKELALLVLDKKKTEYLEAEPEINLRLNGDAIDLLCALGGSKSTQGAPMVQKTMERALDQAISNARYWYGSRTLDVAVSDERLVAVYL